MRLLLDTQTFLWWITDDPRLSERAREIMGDGKNQLFLSAASGWEIAIKAKLGKLKVSDDLEHFIPEQMVLNAVENLPILLSHVLHVYTLPDYHRDPFDRLLISQAQLEGLPILTADSQISRYPVEVVW